MCRRTSMRKPTVKCSLLSTMIAKHRWGTPIGVDELLRLSPLDNQEYPKARECVDELRSENYINNYGDRIGLDNSHFGELADVLYYECEWEPYIIDMRLKHYEGIDTHDWS